MADYKRDFINQKKFGQNVSRLAGTGTPWTVDFRDGLGMVGDADEVDTVFGHAPAIAGLSLRGVWSNATLMNFKTAASAVKVKSTSTDDDAGGIGALTIEISYLTDAFLQKYGTVTLDGTTEVTSTFTDVWRINWAQVKTAGSTHLNIGDINIFDSNGTTLLEKIQAFDGASSTARYTAASDYRTILWGWDVETDVFARFFFTLTCDFDLRTRALDGVYRTLDKLPSVANQQSKRLSPIVIPPGGTVWASVGSLDVSGGGCFSYLALSTENVKS